MSAAGKKIVSQHGLDRHGNRQPVSPKKPKPKRSKSSLSAIISLETLATVQGVGVIENLDDLRGDFWPPHEGVDDFINEIQRLRQPAVVRELP